jgi:hypothetical protein
VTWKAFENPPGAAGSRGTRGAHGTDYKHVRGDGTRVVSVNTGAGPFRGRGGYGTESWPLSSLTDEQLCYQLPRSVREQHPELCK